MIITIIGAGPRGLSTALYALHKGHTVNLIDPDPLHTWNTNYIISNLQMRSPVTFDLVTYIEELQDFSLANFLNIPYTFTSKQCIIEFNNIKVSRSHFSSYLQFILKKITSKINLIKKKVIDVIENNVYLNDSTIIKSDAVVFCIGYTGKLNIPKWLNSTNLSKSIISLNTILSNKNIYKDKKWLVIGSGQGAAEITEYLCNLNGYVNWVTNNPIKVYQYPAPDIKLWGKKSALGDYYRSLNNSIDKVNYLKKVKKWQPSITPYIDHKLKQVNNKYKILHLNNYTDILNLEFDYIVLATGLNPSIASLPTSIKIPSNSFNTIFPNITQGFKLNVPNCDWYVSGILATFYDGPRQHSLISSGLTAKEIINNIEYGNI